VFNFIGNGTKSGVAKGNKLRLDDVRWSPSKGKLRLSETLGEEKRPRRGHSSNW